MDFFRTGKYPFTIISTIKYFLKSCNGLYVRFIYFSTLDKWANIEPLETH